MTQQQRSQLTRHSLLLAAAQEIGRHGRNGAAMHRIARAADVSMGALTFHFPTKEALTKELMELGLSRVRESMRKVGELPAPPLHRARVLLFSLMELLHRDAVVRAAARLTEELPETDSWVEHWLPLARETFRHAEEDGQLRDGVTLEAAVEAALYYVTGAQTRARSDALRGDPADESVRARLLQACDLFLHGVAVTRTHRPG